MFEALLSNKKLKEQLSKSIAENRPLHAYLFVGAKGSGKKTAANELARALVGKNPDKVYSGAHPDVITIAPEKGKKIIPVETIRNMRADAFVKPSEGTRKIYIIDGAHLLNDAGQNALLTILEQPPSFAVFILLSESKGKILSTVISRCVLYEMEYVSLSDSMVYLKAMFPDKPEARLHACALTADGNLGLAVSLVTDDSFDKNAITCTKFLKAVAMEDEYTAASLIIKMDKDSLLSFLPLLAMYIRDILVYRRTGVDTRLVFKSGVLQNKQLFDKIDNNILYGSACACERAMELIYANVSTALITADLTVSFFGGDKLD